ncbi:hypothetical protein B6D25_09905 [Micrococcus luteus]|nr:hypothetical protein B6D25_09905 [Micrococcus luteus]
MTGRARSRRGVRLDLGGPAGLVLTTHDGQRVTVVTPDPETAAELQATVTQATSGGVGAGRSGMSRWCHGSVRRPAPDVLLSAPASPNPLRN